MSSEQDNRIGDTDHDGQVEYQTIFDRLVRHSRHWQSRCRNDQGIEGAV